MSHASREVRRCQKPGHVLNEHGIVEAVPAGWALLPPGDAPLSRRIKQDGPSLTVIEVKGRKRFSNGIWAPADRIAALRSELALERQDPAYARKLTAGRQRRANAEHTYAGDFRTAVTQYLGFHSRYAELEQILAQAISAHATPVGSGTVARTQRIPLEQRAEAATIAWLRHQTTGYDEMNIPRIKGRRRELRRILAQRSKQLLAQYRSGQTIDLARCPLHLALAPARPPGNPAPDAMPRAVQTTLF